MSRFLVSSLALLATVHGAPAKMTLAPEGDGVAEASVSPFMQAKIHRMLGNVLKMDDDQVAELLAIGDEADFKSAMQELDVQQLEARGINNSEGDEDCVW